MAKLFFFLGVLLSRIISVENKSVPETKEQSPVEVKQNSNRYNEAQSKPANNK